MNRSADDFNHERQALDAAHAQNEAGRDAFIALAHTALFAASIAFVGDIAPLAEAVWKPALICGWLASVVGLFALTVSFDAARRAIDARRAALNDEDPPSSRLCEALNATALWSFPVALLCLFSFATANMVGAKNGQLTERPAAAASTAGTARERDQPLPKSAELSRASAPDRSCTGTARACARAPAPTAAPATK